MAVQSVVTQAIDGLELIVVNDNPDQFDDSWFADRLPDGARLIHHDINRGLSAARNTGIDASTGKFIGFLDADDYFTSDGLAQQYALAQRSGADVTHAACFLSRPGSPDVDVLRRDALMFLEPRQGAGLENFEEAQFFTSSWASLYRRDFLDKFNLRFDVEQPKFEDRLFVLETVTAARLIATLGAPTRVWRRRAGSISVSPTNPDIHRLQVQLLEKCLGVIRKRVAAETLPARFEKRELFNTVGRLIWDMDLIDRLVENNDPDYTDFAQRIVSLLGVDSFGHPIFDDEVLAHITRVGMKTKRGFVSRTDFFELHRMLREGDFDSVGNRLAAIKPKHATRKAPAKPLRPKLILHLGMHKTGSTYLQHHLVHHRAALASKGILVPNTGIANIKHASVRQGGLPGHYGLIRALQKRDFGLWKSLRREIENSPAKTVILSCENMLFPLGETRDAQLRALFEQLDMFREIQCVAVVRRPDRYLEAFYKEQVSNGQRLGSRTIQEFMVDEAENLTNLEALFAPFEAYTGTPVRLMDFDEATEQSALWPDFCKMIGLSKRHPKALDDLPRYPSPDRQATEAARLLNSVGGEVTYRQDVLRDFFKVVPTDQDPEPLLSPSERQSLIALFQEQSAPFVAQRGYTPDYSKWHAELDQTDWAPLQWIGQPYLDALIGARLRNERPSTQRLSSKPAQAARSSDASLLTFRVRPRPWLMRIVNRFR